jgi:hypothetical protein
MIHPLLVLACVGLCALLNVFSSEYRRGGTACLCNAYV